MVEQSDKPQATEAELQEMIAATDTGARSPAGGVGKLIIVTAFCWSVFQLWIASPLPYMDVFSSWLPVLNNTDTRSIHLAFAVALAFNERKTRIKSRNSPKQINSISDSS